MARIRAARRPGWAVAVPRTIVVLLIAAPLLLSGIAAAAAPVSYGKTVAPGVFGVPYADTANLSFPYSYPALGDEPLGDGALVYDTQVGFEIVNPNPVEASFLVVTETWTPGTQQLVENLTGPNGTYRFVTVSVPVRLDPAWSNSTVSAAPYSSGTVTLPLRFTSQVDPLEVRVGTATWQLQYLTPATSSVAGVYTAGGIWAFSLLISAVTLGAILAALYFARGIARRIGRSPPVPRWWLMGWIGIPIVWFTLGYVSFNQVLGSASPLVLPIPMAVAVLPYLPRLFTQFYDMTEIEGLEPLTLDSASNPKVILPMVRHQGGLRCAPQTWREALWSLWVGLPEVRGHAVELLGGKVRVQPRVVSVSCPLDGYYRAEVSASAWYDARKGIQRPRHRLVWWIERTETIPGPAGGSAPGSRVRRRFSPHIEAGYLAATFPPKDAVALELAGVRSSEIREHDHEIERLTNADLRGTLDHVARRYADQEIAAHEEARQRQDRPRTRAEIERALERYRKTAANGGRTDGSAPEVKE